MKRSSLLRSGLLVLCCAVQAAAQSYTIHGTLTGSTDGAPIKHGHLTATLAGETSREGAVSTDADATGHFTVPLPGPGVWKLTASARGYRTAALEQHDSFYTGIALRPASRTAEVAFRLDPDAAITGYVLDEAGEAIRSGQVTLLAARELQSEDEAPAWQRQATTKTDDRGHYEFAGLVPGRYQVVVQARPWYADGAPQHFGGSLNGNLPSQTDLPLDMAYPLTWYPGVTDPAAAGIIALEPGGTRQVDVSLLPVPSTHLRLPAPPQTTPGQFDRMSPVPQVQLLWPDGSASFQPIRPTFGPQGAMDLGGLAPGTYRITNLNGGTQAYELRVSPGSGREVDPNAAIPMTLVTVHFDLPEGVAPAGLRLIDTATGRPVLLNTRNGGPMRGGAFDATDSPIQRPPEYRSSGGRLRDGREDREERKLDLPPGRYEVRLADERGQYLTGLVAEGATVSGRFVNIGATACRLTLHVAIGQAVVTGNVMDASASPEAGAMVLLVPTTWGDPQHFVGIERTQTNTDGSFELNDVLRGQYILVAIDRGWQVNWRDPATLRRYLLQGTPIDLNGATAARETLHAQLP